MEQSLKLYRIMSLGAKTHQIADLNFYLCKIQGAALSIGQT